MVGNHCQKFAAQSHSLQLLWLDSWPSLAVCYVTTFFQARRIVIFQLPPLRMNMVLCIMVLANLLCFRITGCGMCKALLPFQDHESLYISEDAVHIFTNLL